MINFKNKNILITGASGGIGSELVKKFVSLGGNVLGSGTNSDKLGAIKKKYPSTIIVKIFETTPIGIIIKYKKPLIIITLKV